MKRFELLEKARQESREKIFDAGFTHYEKAGERGSTGYHGAQFELYACDAMAKYGIKTSYVKKAGCADFTMTVDKHDYAIEIKSGSGIVGQKPVQAGDSIGNYSEADILPGADFVVYAAKPKEFEDMEELLDYSLVFTREEFISWAIENAGSRKHGFSTAFKLGVNNSALRAENKALKAMGEKTYSDCICLQASYLDQREQAIKENYEYCTLREFLQNYGRM